MSIARSRRCVRGVKIVSAGTRHGCGRKTDHGGGPWDQPRSGQVRLPFFVYGTLRPGERYHDVFLRGRTRCEEPGLLPGALLYDGPGYPYAVEQHGGTVTGEIVTALPEAYGELLDALDRLEEYVPGDP